MNVFDIIILLCFVPAIIHGLSKGFVVQAVALISLVLGAWLSFNFSIPVSEWLKSFIHASGTILQVIAFVLILAAVLVGLNILGRMLAGMVKLVMLGWLDKLLGIVFALFKTVLAVGLVIILFDTLNSKFQLVPQKTIDSSALYQPVKDVADVVFPYLKKMIFNK